MKNTLRTLTRMCGDDLLISDIFKKSPLHDKKRIIEILDDLTPEQMSKLVDFLNELGY